MLDKNTPVVPSLHAFSDPMLKTPENVAVYLIQFFFANPGNTSSVNEGEMMSWRKVSAVYGKSRVQEMGVQIGNMLTTSLSHYFPDGHYTATCNVELQEGHGEDGAYLGNYEIIIKIADADGNNIIPMSKVRAALDGNNFTILN